MRDDMQFDDAICRYAICGCEMRIRDAGDKAISESHKCMVHSPAVGSSVNFFSFAAKALFPFIVTPGLYRIDIGSLLSAEERLMAYLDPLNCLYRHCWPGAEIVQSSIYISHFVNLIPSGLAA